MKYPARRRSGVLFSGLLVLAVLVPAFALPGVYAPQAARDVLFAGGGSSVTLPFEEDDGHIVLRGTIGGSAPLWLILDTGATGSLIDSRQARALGLPFGESFQVVGAAGAVDAWEVERASIGLPGLELKDQSMVAMPLDFLAAGKGRPVAALLGYDVFRRLVVEIDYAAGLLHLHDPARFDYRGRGEVLPLSFDGDHAYVRGHLVLPGREPMAGEFVLDTGSPFSLMLARPFAAERRLTQSIGRTIGAKAQGVGGEILLVMGRVGGFRLGSFLVEDQVAVFPQNFGGEIAARGKAGNIGVGLLRRFRVIVDYPRQRLILEPNSAFRKPDEYDMSGLSLVAFGEDLGKVKVSRVMDLSPASEAGLRRGDLLLAVDGRPAAGNDLARLRELFRQDGREVRLSLKRGDETLDRSLKLRRLI